MKSWLSTALTSAALLALSSIRTLVLAYASKIRKPLRVMRAATLVWKDWSGLWQEIIGRCGLHSWDYCSSKSFVCLFFFLHVHTLLAGELRAVVFCRNLLRCFICIYIFRLNGKLIKDRTQFKSFIIPLKELRFLQYSKCLVYMKVWNIFFALLFEL